MCDLRCSRLVEAARLPRMNGKRGILFELISRAQAESRNQKQNWQYLRVIFRCSQTIQFGTTRICELLSVCNAMLCIVHIFAIASIDRWHSTLSCMTTIGGCSTYKAFNSKTFHRAWNTQYVIQRSINRFSSRTAKIDQFVGRRTAHKRNRNVGQDKKSAYTIWNEKRETERHREKKSKD